jgi:hypothetical protein
LKALLLILLLGACERGAPDVGCRSDGDCGGGRCVVGTGVCVRSSGSLDASTD